MPAVERRPVCVLVVDDDAAGAEALVRLLRHEGCETLQAPNLTDAMRIAVARRLDVLVADLSLSDGSGCELLRRVLTLQPRVRGVALTGHCGPHYERLCREAGF